MSNNNNDYSRKFASQLGNLNDFIDYVKKLEENNRLHELNNFVSTRGTSGPRYLLIKRGGVIDFRHFFAAMRLRTDGIGDFSSTSEGGTLLLGVLNEVAQCMDEVTKWKLNSCFSKEDLTSNRLGARFGEILIIKQSEASSMKISDLLYSYLMRFDPMLTSDIVKINMPSTGDNVVEVLGAVLKNLGDLLVPSAY